MFLICNISYLRVALLRAVRLRRRVAGWGLGGSAIARQLNFYVNKPPEEGGCGSEGSPEEEGGSEEEGNRTPNLRRRAVPIATGDRRRVRLRRRVPPLRNRTDRRRRVAGLEGSPEEGGCNRHCKNRQNCHNTCF